MGALIGSVSFQFLFLRRQSPLKYFRSAKHEEKDQKNSFRIGVCNRVSWLKDHLSDVIARVIDIQEKGL